MYSRETSRTRRKSKPKNLEDMKKVEPQTEGLLLDEVLAADKEVADMYLNRFVHSLFSFLYLYCCSNYK